MIPKKQRKPVRHLEFCYSPASRGYFIYDWTGNVNITRYNWHKIEMFNEIYAVMAHQDFDEATAIVRKYLADDDYGLISRIRLD